MELGVSHVQNLSSLTPIVDNIFDKYNKNLVPIRSLSDHDTISLGLCMMYMYENYTNTAQASYKGEWGSYNKFVLNNAKNKI